MRLDDWVRGRDGEYQPEERREAMTVRGLRKACQDAENDQYELWYFLSGCIRLGLAFLDNFLSITPFLSMEFYAHIHK